MAIYQYVGYSDTGGVTEHALQDANASASGGLSAGNHTQIVTAAMVWNVAEFNTLTFTWQNDMAVYYWTNPAGSYTNSTRSCCLVLGDGTEVLIGEGNTGTATVDLSQYTNEQKSSVRLRGKLNYYLSTVTNAANKGGITATNVIARGLGQGGNVYCEIGKLYEFGGNGFSPISKVYDFDGTANHLIYSGTPEYLYKDGDQAVGDTGGWVGVTEGIFWYSSSSGVIDSSAWDASPSRAQAPTFEDTYINLYENGQNTYRGCTVRTANAIDITDIASLVFTFYDDLPSSSSTLRYNVVTAALGSDTTPTIVTGYRLNVRSDGTHTITLDTSALSGEYYIYFGNSTGDGHSMTTKLQVIEVNATT